MDAAPAATKTKTGEDRKVTCDKCDGPHLTDKCPHFSKPREQVKEGDIVYDEDTRLYSFACPHCGEIAQVARYQINCRIFRHAQFKGRGHGQWFVNPHAPKAECDRWVREGLIYGCGKPFRFDGNSVQKCGYI